MSHHGQREIIFSILLGGGEILPLEEKQVESSASHAGIGEIKYRTEENDLLPLGNQREVEHIHNLAEHKRSIVPYKPIEKAVNHIAYGSCSDLSQPNQHSFGCLGLFCEL